MGSVVLVYNTIGKVRFESSSTQTSARTHRYIYLYTCWFEGHKVIDYISIPYLEFHYGNQISPIQPLNLVISFDKSCIKKI